MYYRERGPFMAVYLLDSRTLLHIPAERANDTMLNLIGQLLRRSANGPLADALAEAGNHTVVAAARVEPFRNLMRMEGELPRELTPYHSLLKAKTVVFTADVAAKSTATVKLIFGNAASAKRAAPVLKTLIQNGVDALADMARKPARTPRWPRSLSL